MISFHVLEILSEYSNMKESRVLELLRENGKIKKVDRQNDNMVKIVYEGKPSSDFSIQSGELLELGMFIHAFNYIGYKDETWVFFHKTP